MNPPTGNESALEQSIRRYFDELANAPVSLATTDPPRRHRRLVLVAVASAVVVVVVAAGLALAARGPSTRTEQVTTATAPTTPNRPAPTTAPAITATTPVQTHGTANPFPVTGVVALNDHDPRYSATVPGQPCTASAKYSAIHDQALLTVTDAAGATIATTTLGPGTIATGGSADSRDCEFPFTIAALPTSPSYTFSVQDGLANTFTVSFTEASSQHLTLYVGACC